MRTFTKQLLALALTALPAAAHAQSGNTYGTGVVVNACGLQADPQTGDLVQYNAVVSKGFDGQSLPSVYAHVDTAGGSAFGYAILSGGRLGVAANSVFTPQTPFGSPCSSGAGATLWEEISLRNDTDVWQWQPFDVDVDGIRPADQSIPGQWDATAYATFSMRNDTYGFGQALFTGSTTVLGGFWTPPGVSTHSLMMYLAVWARNGLSVDFSHTARASLPPVAGVHFVGSASGVFLSDQVVPEPATLGSFALGGAVLLLAVRRRRVPNGA